MGFRGLEINAMSGSLCEKVTRTIKRVKIVEKVNVRAIERRQVCFFGNGFRVIDLVL